MKDYYAILGLDSGASPALIKLAYRRLAYEYHPDRFAGTAGAEADLISERMREINEAYHVLSNAAARQEYDRSIQPGTGAIAVAAPTAEPEPVGRPRKVRVAPPASILPSVCSEFSTTVRKKLNGSGWRWRDVRWEGFDWAQVSGLFPRQHGIALRAFAAADLRTAEKITNYAQVAVAGASRLRLNYFLFLMPFQRITQLEEVTALCRQFCYASRKDQTREVVVALVDIAHEKSLLCGPVVRDARFMSVLRSLGFSGG